MQTLKMARMSRALMILMSATVISFVFTATATGQQAVQDADPAQSATAVLSGEGFTGSLTVRQQGGSLYYQVYVVEGTVIGGYDTWRGLSTKYHRIVGGWYDGDRMVLLIQSTQDDLGDKWYSHAHHFEKKDDRFVITHSLYGFGTTIDSGEVYTPHTIDEISELTPEEVRQLAAADEHEPSPPATPDADEAALTRRVSELEQENACLNELVARLVCENRNLRRELRDD